MVVSQAPIGWDFGRWRRTLEAYRIDGKPVLDLTRARDKARLDRLMSIQVDLTPQPPGGWRPIELCPAILARTANLPIVTDDNMGSEWRKALGLD